MSRRLFIATGIFHPEPGGPATYLHEILPALQARDWQVRLLTYGQGPVDDYPYPVVRVPRTPLPHRVWAYGRAARSGLAWADYVYAHTIDLPLPGPRRAPRLIKIVGDQAWERCMRRGWIPPDTDIDAFQEPGGGALVAWQKTSRARQVRAMDGVVVPSQYLAGMVAGWGVPRDRIHVIYNALPPAHHDEPMNQQTARAALGWDGAPLLLTAARLERWKGIDHLLTALPAVPDVRLVIAGDGPDRERLMRLAQPLGDRVRWLGRIPRPDLHRWMCAADYFALYSGYEGLSHSLLESLRAGTPVIASDKGGNPEVVQAGQNGLLVPYVDHDALRTTLQKAFSGDVRARLARATQHDLGRFGFDQMVAHTHELLLRYTP